VGGLFKEVTKRIVCPFFGISPTVEEEEEEEENETVTGTGTGTDGEGWQRGWLELVKDIPLRGNW
jgi:hypothetical protein